MANKCFSVVNAKGGYNYFVFTSEEGVATFKALVGNAQHLNTPFEVQIDVQPKLAWKWHRNRYDGRYPQKADDFKDPKNGAIFPTVEDAMLHAEETYAKLLDQNQLAALYEKRYLNFIQERVTWTFQILPVFE